MVTGGGAGTHQAFHGPRPVRERLGGVVRLGGPSPGCPVVAVADHVHAAARSGDRDVPVPIGAQHRDTCVGQQPQRARRGMAVRVVRADGGDRHPGAHRPEEARILVRAAVVRDLQHIGTHVDTAGQQRVLGLRLDVACEQQGEPPADHPQHDRGVVRIGVGAVEGGLGRHHLPRQVADATTLAVNHPLERYAGSGGPATHPGELAGGLVERADLDRADPAAV